MYVLGVDVETTGLSSESDKIIEIGAVVWDTEVDKPIAILSHLININKSTSDVIRLSNKIIQLTDITDIDLDIFGVEEQQALTELLTLVDKCDYIVAHNGNKFDKPFIDNALKTHGLVIDKPWIDSLYDVPYNESIKSKKLTELAIHHDCPNDYSHRAVFDVLTMLRVCSYYDWQEIIDLQKIPVITIVANISDKESEEAKSAGFYFDRNTSQWKKKIKEIQLNSLCYSFECSVCS
ncbi:MAG: DNA polymerase-3 subunit epsilon [Colwellia sp.]|jgi:DNA polymerase-3 subunit epsilon